MPTTLRETASTGSRNIFSAGTNTGPTPMKQDISDVIDAIDPRDIPLLSVLGFGAEASAAAGADSLRFPCIQPVHSWLNDELIPSVSLVVSSSGGPPVTTVNVTTGEGTYFDGTANAEDIIMIENGHYKVTTVATDALTVASLDGTSPAAPAVGATIYIIGNASREGILSTEHTFEHTVTTQTDNYTQIFSDYVSVSGSWQSTEQYGVDNPFDREVDKKIKETVIKLERAAHYGRRSASPFPSSNATPFRRMGGLWYYLRGVSGTNATDAGGGSLTESRLLDILQDCWTDGGKPSTIWVGARQKRALNNFILPFVQTSRTEGVAGVVVGRYESDFGDLKVVLDRYLKPDDVVVTTDEYLGIGPLKGNGRSRALSIEDMPKRGDLTEAFIVGEYTMEVRNNQRAHGWLYNLASS